jgi:hypothetical protein
MANIQDYNGGFYSGVLYHGTSKSSYDSIIQNGFIDEFIGSGYGTTYGPGFYFTPDINIAKSYSDDNKIIKINCKNIKLLNLDDIKLNTTHRKRMSQLIKIINSKQYDGFIKFHRNNSSVVEIEVIIHSGIRINKMII